MQEFLILSQFNPRVTASKHDSVMGLVHLTTASGGVQAALIVA
jgi:hypothetical protein